MKKIALIVCYFGKLPNYFPLYLKSCSYNETINYIFFSDCDYSPLPKNVEIIKMSFTEFKTRVQSNFNFPISLETPYKICDFKPAYGLIFEKELVGYDFWGYCDFDQIFGNVKKFLSDEILNNYDKIYQLGHLTLFRNTEENNKVFMKDGVQDYKKSFSSKIITVFDEKMGVGDKFSKLQIPQYISRDYADISAMKNRFTLSNEFISEKELKNNNYEKQIFYFDKGKVFRSYLDKNNKIKKDEFNYIHFSQRQMPVNFENYKNVNSFYITNKGFFEKEKEVTIEIIEKLNGKTPIKDKIVFLKYWKKRAKNKVFKIIQGQKESRI